MINYIERAKELAKYFEGRWAFDSTEAKFVRSVPIAIAKLEQELADMKVELAIKEGSRKEARRYEADAKAKLTERDKLLDECKEYIIAIENIENYDPWQRELLTKLQEREK